jgi:AraC-like DNA-binding protein
VPDARWEPAVHLPGVQRMLASNWVSDFACVHESYDFCSMDWVEGDRGPVNRYRAWKHSARPGDVLCFEPGSTHKAAGGPRADYRALLVPVRLMEAARSEATDRFGEVHLKELVAPSAYVHLQRVHDLISDPSAESSEVEEEFISSIQHILDRYSEDGTDRVDAVDDRVVGRAIEYANDMLESNPDEHLSLDEVARKTGARGKFKLCRDFKSVTHLGVYEYFKYQKLNRARHLLVAQRSKSVHHIAWDLGYTLSSFSRAFHRQFGLSPRRYRAAFEP